MPAKVPPSLADPTPAEATEVLEVAMGPWGSGGRSDGKVGYLEYHPDLVRG